MNGTNSLEGTIWIFRHFNRNACIPVKIHASNASISMKIHAFQWKCMHSNRNECIKVKMHASNACISVEMHLNRNTCIPVEMHVSQWKCMHQMHVWLCACIPMKCMHVPHSEPNMPTGRKHDEGFQYLRHKHSLGALSHSCPHENYVTIGYKNNFE